MARLWRFFWACSVLFGCLSARQAFAQPAPPISNELPIDTPISNPVPEPTVAYGRSAFNGTVYLLCWGVFGDDNIYGRIYDANGAAVTSKFVISNFGRCEVASNGTDFLVAVGDNNPVKFVRVGSNGVVLTPTVVVDSVTSSIALKYAQGNYVLAWVKNGLVRATRIDANGSVLDPGGKAISVVASASPQFASNGTHFLFVWQQQDDLVGRRVDGSLNPVDAAPSLMLSAIYQQQPVQVVSNGNDFLVTYETQNITQLSAIRVSAAGAVLDAAPIAIANDATTADATFDGTDYLVGWSNGTADIWGRRINSAGALLEAAKAICNAPEHQDAPRFSQGGKLVTYLDTRRNIANELYGNRIDPGFNVLDGPGVWFAGSSTYTINKQLTPSVAALGNQYLVAWTDYRKVPSQVYASRVLDDGTVIDTDAILLGTGQGPSVTTMGADFFVAWSDQQYVRFTRVSPTGVVSHPGGKSHTYIPSEMVSQVSAASNGTHAAIVYTSANAFDIGPEVWMLFLNNNLDNFFPNGSVYQLTYSPYNSDPRVIFDGVRYAVVWFSSNNEFGSPGAQNNVCFQRWDPTATPKSEASVALSVDGPENFDPDITSDGTNSFVVWRRRGNMTSSLMGLRVSNAGLLLDYPFVVNDFASQKDGPTVAFDGTDFVATWRDMRADTEGDIYAARVSSAAQLIDPLGFEVSAYPASSESYAAAAHIGTSMVVVYTRDDKDPAIKQFRTRMRLVTSMGGGGGTGGAGGMGGMGGAGGTSTSSSGGSGVGGTSGTGAAGGASTSSSGGSGVGGMGGAAGGTSTSSSGGSGVGGMGGSSTGGTTAGTGAGDPGTTSSSTGVGGNTGGDGGSAGNGNVPPGGGTCTCNAPAERNTPNGEIGVIGLAIALLPLRRRKRRGEPN